MPSGLNTVEGTGGATDVTVLTEVATGTKAPEGSATGKKIHELEITVVSPDQKSTAIVQQSQDRHAMLAAMKKAAPTPGKSFLRVIGFSPIKISGQERLLFTIEFLNKDGDAYWMMKNELVPAIIKNGNSEFSARNPFLGTLEWCRVRETPFDQDSTCKKTERNYDVVALYGYLPVSPFHAMDTVGMEERLKNVGEGFKALITNKDFRFYYEALVQESFPKVGMCYMTNYIIVYL
jgi:hypothetical protein